MTKTFILDTNVLLHDPKAIFAFEDNEVVIPLIVLDELDRHKSGRTQTSAHARQVIRSLDELRATGNISHGVKTSLGGYIRVELNYAENVPTNLDATRADNRIIGVALGIKEAYEGMRDVRVITKDINLRVKCDALQVPSEDYNSDAVVRNLNDLYSGNTVIDVDADDVGRMYNEGFIEVKNIFRPLYSNEYVLVRSNIDPKHTCLGRFDGLNIARVTPVKNVWSISPRNKEQVFAFDALFNPDVKLATITGIAGCGKTLIAASAGISQLFDKNLYKRIVLTRPVVPVGPAIGFLPGPQPLDAKILTPSGWSEMGRLKIGDSVIGKNGKPAKVIGVYPKGAKSVYKITTTDGTQTECCEDHLWVTKTKEDKKRGMSGCVKLTKDIMSTLCTKDGKPNHYLPRNDAVEYNDVDIPIPAYTMGVILGDGSISDAVSVINTDDELLDRVRCELDTIGCSLSSSSNGCQYRISSFPYSNKPAKKVSIINLTSGDEKIYSSALEVEKVTGVNKTTINGRCNRNAVIGNEKYKFLPSDNVYQNIVKDILHKMGLRKGCNAPNKFVPDIYKYNSIQKRIDVLRGFMDSDGTITEKGESTFSTTSLKLAEDFRDIVRSLGGRSHIRVRDRVGQISRSGKENGTISRDVVSNHVGYDVSVSLPESINPFYISRKSKKHKCKYIQDAKISDIAYAGEKEVQCIMLDSEDKLYLTDDFIVTHNTMDDKMQPWMGPLYDNLDLIFSERGRYLLDSSMNEGVIQVEPMTYIRGRSMPNSYIICDEAQNLTRHEIKTLITRVGEGSKVVLTGDVQQIDTPYLDSSDNGLSYVIEKFKEDEISAHITMVKGERSELATKAAERL